MRQPPGAVTAAVEAVLRARGVIRLYGAACSHYAVLSVTREITVWSDGRLLTWRHDGEQFAWPARDPDGAAARLAALVHADVDPNRTGC